MWRVLSQFVAFRVGQQVLWRVREDTAGVCDQNEVGLQKGHAEPVSNVPLQGVFSLAFKLSPAIIFVDEIDGLLCKRGAHTNELELRLKTQFMSLCVAWWGWFDWRRACRANICVATQTAGLLCHRWSGLNSTSSGQPNQVLVIGTTNRPDALDPAVLRRLPRSIHIGLPKLGQREHILRVVLRSERLDDDFDFGIIAQKTEGMSGSDLKVRAK